MILLNSIHSWDGRTKKMDDFKKQPWAEICWYFTETREQYRLSGKISVIDANAEDKAQRVIVAPLNCILQECDQFAVPKRLVALCLRTTHSKTFGSQSLVWRLYTCGLKVIHCL